MKKYCIETLEKHKSDIVGVGIPDDPLKKKKHTNKLMSNNQTSNIKFCNYPNCPNYNNNRIVNPCRCDIINGNGRQWFI